MDIEFSTEPIAAGEARPFRAHGVAPITVQIKCFANKPPPPGFKPCPECGTFKMKSGESQLIRVSETTFSIGGGSLEIVAKDSSGAIARFSLEVVGWGKPGAGQPPPASGSRKPTGGAQSKEKEYREQEIEERA